MKKILYIRIDNAPVPQVLKDEIEEFDCRQINDFCSFVGDVIIGDLRDNDGTPYYRLIKPAGQLLMNFKAENAGLFGDIVSQWMDILGDILNKGTSENASFVIKFPQKYIDWLCQNEDLNYSYIGNNLKKNGSIVTLNTQELIEDVISILRLKIERYLQSHQDEFEYITFSNPHIGISSDGVKQIKDIYGCFRFMKIEHLIHIYEDIHEKDRAHSEQTHIQTKREIDEKYCGHEYVDLGLPSGLKWATCNVGASKPSDYGLYYSWGATYHYTPNTGSLAPLVDINGNPDYDVVRAQWGGSWRLPTWMEFEELIRKCTWIMTSQDGHNGYIVKGPNGKTIFFPFAGSRGGKYLYGDEEMGQYWSSTPVKDHLKAYELTIYMGRKSMDWGERNCGNTIRGVSE